MAKDNPTNNKGKKSVDATDNSRRDFLKKSGMLTALAIAPPTLMTASENKWNEKFADFFETVPLSIQINGVMHNLQVEPRTTLLDLLREQLELTGSKKGCDHGQCGACTVHIEGKRVLSCLTLALAAKLMQPNEIKTLAKLFVSQGVKKIRLTGGEPLVRKDAPNIIHALGQLNVELAITTNGIRIHEMLVELQSANMQSINISLDTLQPDKFLKITRRDLYHRVRSNIELLLHHNMKVKINVVVMKGLNENEILDFIALTKHNNIEIRFIEFMPFSGNHWTSNQVFALHEILSLISTTYDALPVKAAPNDTSKRYMIPGHIGSFAVISTMSQPFCESCNRMRLTADGKLKNCLFSTTETDLLGALRRGDEVIPLIHQSIQSKAKALGGQFSGVFENIDAGKIQNRSMITIGG